MSNRWTLGTHANHSKGIDRERDIFSNSPCPSVEQRNIVGEKATPLNSGYLGIHLNAAGKEFPRSLRPRCTFIRNHQRRERAVNGTLCSTALQDSPAGNWLISPPRRNSWLEMEGHKFNTCCGGCEAVSTCPVPRRLSPYFNQIVPLKVPTEQATALYISLSLSHTKFF